MRGAGMSVRPRRGLPATVVPTVENNVESDASDSSSASVRDLSEDQRREIHHLFMSTEADHQTHGQLAETYQVNRTSIRRYTGIDELD